MSARGLGVAALVVSLVALTAALWLMLAPSGGRNTDAPASSSARAGAGASASEGAGDGVFRKRGVQGADIRVFGRVIDPDGGPLQHGVLTLECANDGRPIRGGTVRLDESGAFEGPGCRGLVCAQLQHPSLIQAEPWLLEVGVEAELYARPLARLEGTVTDGRDPIAGAAVEIAVTEDDPTGMPPFIGRRAQTDAEGRFALARVEIPPCDLCAQTRGLCAPGEPRDDVLYRGGLSLVATAAGYRAAALDLSTDTVGPVELSLALDDAPVTGTLHGPDGGSFRRAEIVLRSSERSHEAHRGRAREDGSFEIGGLGEGTYELRAYQDGVELLLQNGIRAGARLDLMADQPARGARLEVVVRDTEGAPVVGARVQGQPFSDGQGVTDADGRVVAEQVLEGRHSISVWRDGERPVRKSVDVGNDGELQVEFEL